MKIGDKKDTNKYKKDLTKLKSTVKYPMKLYWMTLKFQLR
jgi:hypothetical protein